METNTSTDEEYQDIPSTSYDNPDLPHISEQLADVMDDLGFSEKLRKHRVKLGMMRHMFETISEAIAYCGKACALMMGSYAEGTTSHGMGSDLDGLMFSASVKAHRDTASTNKTLGVVLIRDDITPAGYIKLQPVYDCCECYDASYINKVIGLYWGITLATDKSRRLVVTHFMESDSADCKHGPADTYKNRPNAIDIDIVRSFLCNDMINEMEKWCVRNRMYDWPCKDTRDLFKKLGFFVVPVGHPSSPEKDIEWRISFSLQERHLMWHLNPTQYHCFMMLKLIKTFLIKPQFGDVLTSYQCKTLLFYTIERNEQGIWIPEKLILCLRMCLMLLQDWLTKRCIPNYFIPKENMFVKMDASLGDKYANFKSYVAAMCDSWEYLFRIGFNDIGLHFYETLKCIPVKAVVLEDIPQVGINVYELKHAFSSSTTDCMNEIQNTLSYIDIVLAVLGTSRTYSRYTTIEESMADLYQQWFAGPVPKQYSLEQSNQLIHSYQCHAESSEKQAMKMAVIAFKSELLTTLGSVVAAKYFQTRNEHYLVNSDRYFELGTSIFPTTSMLVKVTVMLKQSLFDVCSVMINSAESIYQTMAFSSSCYTYTAMYCLVGAHKRRECTVDGTLFHSEDDFATFMCPTCFYFKRCEYDILPNALTFEAYRSFGIADNIVPSFSKPLWSEMVVVDPVMYLYYLQFLSNQHNNTGDAAVALHTFETTLFERLEHPDWPGHTEFETTLLGRLERSDWPGHTDTWLNVLGDIFVKKGWTRLALRCFKYSDKVRPSHNAVRWHVMFLLFSTVGANV